MRIGIVSYRQVKYSTEGTFNIHSPVIRFAKPAVDAPVLVKPLTRVRCGSRERYIKKKHGDTLERLFGGEHNTCHRNTM